MRHKMKKLTNDLTGYGNTEKTPCQSGFGMPGALPIFGGKGLTWPDADAFVGVQDHLRRGLPKFSARIRQSWSTEPPGEVPV
ncbi:hypothetical protein GCM10023085_57620 [Actinomadura viridis]